MFDEARLASALAQYRAEGYARLGVVASNNALAALRTRADDLMMGRIQIPGMFFQMDTTTGAYADLTFGRGYEGASRNYRKIEKLEKDDLFRQWVEHPLFVELARRVYGPHVAVYRAVLFSKAAHGGTHLPWHQDGGKFWGLDRDPELQIWMALDDAPIDAGCVAVVPRSHLGGLVTPLGGVVPEEHVRARDPESNAVLLPARAGEVLLLHNKAWHRSGVNRTAHPRRALTICYLHGATKCVRKKRTPRVFPIVLSELEGRTQ